VALGRAWLQLGETQTALDTLGATAPHGTADYVVATWRRIRAAGLQALGEVEGANHERARLAADGPELWSYLAQLDEALLGGNSRRAAIAAQAMIHAEFGFEAARLLVRLAPVATEHERFHDLALLAQFARWFRY
jgi:hypothetical protein